MFIGFAAALHGCAAVGPEMTWHQDGMTMERKAEDSATCRADHGQGANLVLPSLAGQIIDRSTRQAENFRQCMVALGWRLVEASTAPALPYAASLRAAGLPLPRSREPRAQPAGTWATQAAQLPDALACRAGRPPAAELATPPGPVESYIVRCAGGDLLTVRCDAAGCRALR